MLRRVSLILALALAAGSTAGAQAPAPSRSAALDKLRADQVERMARRAQWEQDAVAARREIDQLNAQLSALITSEGAGDLFVSDKRLKLASLSVRETELAARAGANRNRLSRLLGALEMYSRQPPPALLVHPADAKDAVRAAILIRALTPELEKRARVFAAEEEAFRKIRREAAQDSAALFSAESDLADQRAQIEALIADKTQVERSLAAEILIADNEIAALASRARSLGELVGGLPAGALATAGTLSLSRPVSGEPTARFRQRGGDGRMSEGWVWRPAPGAAVVSPGAGVVEYSGPVPGWGAVLIVRASGGYHLVLGGLETTLVTLGQSVAPGQPVGRMANPGGFGVASRPSDLHLEVRKDGEPVDPARFMQ